MGRRLDDVIAALPAERRAGIDSRFEELKAEVEGLGELRRVAGKAQAEIASILKIKQPSVSKMEKQADMYLSTLRSYVEAVGGHLDLIVSFPSRAPLRIERLGDVATPPRATARKGGAAASGRNSRAKAAPAS